MSAGPQVPSGRPDAMVEEATHLFFVYCGGMGGAACVLPIGSTGVTFPVKIPKFITRNIRLVFENPEFGGLRIYSDAGPNGFCAHSLGSDVPTYMALSVDGNLTPAEIMARGVILTGPTPYTIEFTESKIPQPINQLWDGNIYVQLYWGDAGYISGVGANPSDNTLQITKHDYEILQ